MINIEMHVMDELQNRHNLGGIKTFLTKLLSDKELCEQLDEDVNSQNYLFDMMRAWAKRNPSRYKIAEPNDFLQRISSVSLQDLATSQGVYDCYTWKGLSLYKSLYDFALYPLLLWQLKPKTIIELGSGNGASALWMSDLCKNFGITSKIISVDKKSPILNVENVTFIEADVYRIRDTLSPEFLESLPHPWLFIEDAHHNVTEVLNYLDGYFQSGDYLYLEDVFIAQKSKQIQQFLAKTQNQYCIDHYFTDFFGINATCAENAIWVRQIEDRS